MRAIIFLGGSGKNIQGFPKDVQELITDGLTLLRRGGMPQSAKPFRGVGSGVYELAIRHYTGAYRAVVAVRLGKTVYVLHAFQKKSKQGIKTPQQDIDLIRQRYREAQELAKDED